MAERLKDKIAFVMGAGFIGEGWGNGKATAVHFAREGAAVICVDRDLASAERTAAIISEEGGKAEALRADITSASDIDAAVCDVIARHGRIDILQNNVGIAEPGGPEAIDEASWDRVMDVNLKGFFLTCKRVLPEMVRQGGGAIVNVSSVASITTIAVPMISYYSSKAAVNHFTRAIAVEYASKGIRCNAVLPGLMNTPMIVEPYRHVYASVDDMIAKRDAMVPMGKMGTAWDVAYASLFLASDEAKYISGVLLPVDGALTCQTR
ncbi:SDR family NAD(P)-dependent oxidoreductase [Phreatobacter sp.]|uniref:SDR family NAD(P)-dependent oxidoreductase n=1 Tax=Phreatobacter sp. TaxID=1966341 RepID=UPI003F7268B9